jgi:pilus assembly protein Flp/PilA
MNRETIADLVLLATVKGTLKFKNLLRRLREDASGQDLIEYALLIALISLVAIGSITAAGTSINAVWNKISANLAAAAS